MRNYIRAILGVLLIAMSIDAVAQDKFVVRGKVLDDANKEAIIGANILEVSEGDRFLNGSITDFNGDFVLEVAGPQSKIKISFIGYVDQLISLEGKDYFTIRLKESVKQLSTVDVVVSRTQSDGLVEIAERDLTGSQVKVDLENMSEVAATTAEEALQGEVAGVDIVMNSGDPGSGATMVIRGMSSLNGSQPLFVINGIPQSFNADDDFDFGSADSEDIGQLISIAPADIKSITVLKDAASTAQYGTEGANGVIVIETKRGVKGDAQFRYMYKYNFSEQPPSIPLLNGDDYVTLQMEQRFNRDGVYTVADQLENDPNSPLFYNYGRNTDWLKEVSQDAIEKEHSLQVKGGGDKTLYFASVNIKNNQGTTINTGLDQLTSRVDLDYNVSDKVRFKAEFTFSNSKVDNPMILDKKNIRAMAYIKAPNMSIYEYDQYGVETGNYFTPLDNYQGSSYFNPVALSNLGENYKENSKIATNLTLFYDIYKKELKFKALIAYNYSNEVTKSLFRLML